MCITGPILSSVYRGRGPLWFWRRLFVVGKTLQLRTRFSTEKETHQNLKSDRERLKYYTLLNEVSIKVLFPLYFDKCILINPIISLGG